MGRPERTSYQAVSFERSWATLLPPQARALGLEAGKCPEGWPPQVAAPSPKSPVEQQIVTPRSAAFWKSWSSDAIAVCGVWLSHEPQLQLITVGLLSVSKIALEKALYLPCTVFGAR